ncbi:hypothetical protein VTJ04DRAFT_10411 [Mycothermus thermophilus]|uniref:uncharacterized protein n=1 Tax=Humicola insolens TaxID=85995 RepID=UPI003743EE1E
MVFPSPRALTISVMSWIGSANRTCHLGLLYLAQAVFNTHLAQYALNSTLREESDRAAHLEPRPYAIRSGSVSFGRK